MEKERITRRLEDLGISQFEAAKRTGKHEHFIYDFFKGRKKSFKGEGLLLLAHALECSVEYLTGQSDEVGSPPRPTSAPASPQTNSVLPFAGVAEAGVFHKVGAVSIDQDQSPLCPFIGYPASAQSAYLMRGDGLAARGISEGMFLTAVDKDAAPDLLRSGAVVIARHTRLSGSEIEISARELQFFPDRTELIAHPSRGDIQPIIIRDGQTEEKGGRAEILAIVVAATLAF